MTFLFQGYYIVADKAPDVIVNYVDTIFGKISFFGSNAADGRSYDEMLA